MMKNLLLRIAMNKEILHNITPINIDITYI